MSLRIFLLIFFTEVYTALSGMHLAKRHSSGVCVHTRAQDKAIWPAPPSPPGVIPAPLSKTRDTLGLRSHPCGL